MCWPKSRKAIDYGVQVAQGLAIAHAKEIVHRDLKPEYLFLTKDGRVKILDFGLAKAIQKTGSLGSDSQGATPTSAQTAAGLVMGTASYTAPEQVRGEALDARTDIFSFGAVLYEMLSGHGAFRRDTSAETMTAVLKDDPPELTDVQYPISPVLERIVLRCLEKSSEQRFRSAKDLAFALEALSGNVAFIRSPSQDRGHPTQTVNDCGCRALRNRGPRCRLLCRDARCSQLPAT